MPYVESVSGGRRVPREVAQLADWAERLDVVSKLQSFRDAHSHLFTGDDGDEHTLEQHAAFRAFEKLFADLVEVFVGEQSSGNALGYCRALRDAADADAESDAALRAVLAALSFADFSRSMRQCERSSKAAADAAADLGL
ncbi:hypothetical protein M885DRAFT_623352 [Pelagophyceae sp. CCMP2097]|nr:hypothetical protein M885DRAFT_623352 [Pelagophyceae sp. CCMP2097]